MKTLEPPESYKSVLYQKAFHFAVRIIRLYKYLFDKERLYKQLLRSGTSIGANVSKAQSAPSKKNFVNKLSTALKEARESEYWINLLVETELLIQPEYDSLINDCDDLERLLTSSIKSARSS